MADTVKVSLLQPQNVRMSKSEPYTRYKAGIVDMPMAHVEALGLRHRVVRISTTPTGEEIITAAPFGGVFDGRLVDSLTNAGFSTLDELRGLSRDQLLDIEGVGPANYERIAIALGEV